MTKKQLIEKAIRVHAFWRKSWNKTQLNEQVATRNEWNIDTVNNCIEHHESHQRAYFWTPPGNASARRTEEKRKNFTHYVYYAGDEYTFESHVSCSCKNYYYTGTFSKNGEKKNMRLFRNLLTKLEQEK